ncbi:MAG: redox-sensing transcriptional repressor Rex [Lachnospiraceae bacterium]|nr:redox-sensing transcriptional repressor Rex [Lachnospiraceae bacterium]
MENKGISRAVIKRLPRYYRYLGELKEEGVERISSSELSSKMKVTASQIRQDLNNFGGFGQQGYGYNVNYLFNEIGRILGIDKKNNMIVIGAGNMGQALTKYTSFRSYGFDIIGVFDVNANLIGKSINGIVVQDYSEVASFIRNNPVDIAVLTVPKEAAGSIAEYLVQLGIHAFWNFAYTDLRLGPGIVVENVHLSDSLLRLSYEVKSKGASND